MSRGRKGFVARHRVGAVVGIGALFVLFTGLFGTGSNASARVDRSAARGIGGTYQVVVHYTTGLAKGQTVHETFKVKTIDRATGRFVGAGTSDVGNIVRISGLVKGSKIVMRLVDAGAGNTVRALGAIRPGGLISGTLRGRDRTGKSIGTWTMTPASVVVDGTGWGRRYVSGALPGYHLSYAVKATNRSTRDAFGVAVTISYSNRSTLRTPRIETFILPEVPAGQSVVLAGSINSVEGVAHLTHVNASIYVNHIRRHSSTALQPMLQVSNVQIERRSHAVTAVITNPSDRSPIDLSRTGAFTALFNAKGQIIGGGGLPTIYYGVGPKTIKPGAYTRIHLQVDGPMANVAHAEVSALTFPQP